MDSIRIAVYITNVSQNPGFCDNFLCKFPHLFIEELAFSICCGFNILIKIHVETHLLLTLRYVYVLYNL